MRTVADVHWASIKISAVVGANDRGPCNRGKHLGLLARFVFIDVDQVHDFGLRTLCTQHGERGGYLAVGNSRLYRRLQIQREDAATRLQFTAESRDSPLVLLPHGIIRTLNRVGIRELVRKAESRLHVLVNPGYEAAFVAKRIKQLMRLATVQDGQSATALLMPEDDPFEGAEIEDIKKFLSEDQRTGDLHGREIWDQMVSWLRKRGCAHLVSPHLLEQYSMAMARWIQLERVNSEFGFISKHPTTGAPITSPVVTMAQGYLKQANVLFQQIFAIVSENCREPVTGNPQDDIMEKLLGM